MKMFALHHESLQLKIPFKCQIPGSATCLHVSRMPSKPKHYLKICHSSSLSEVLDGVCQAGLQLAALRIEG